MSVRVFAAALFPGLPFWQNCLELLFCISSLGDFDCYLKEAFEATMGDLLTAIGRFLVFIFSVLVVSGFNL